MKNQIYHNCKSVLFRTAKEATRLNENDLPFIRQELNNQLDELIRQIDFHVIRETLTSAKGEIYKTWLTNYCISLHPTEPRYKVVKIFNVSGRVRILKKGLTREEAKRVVNSYPDSNRSMVIFSKM